jgi:4-hydroxythreonine-4-phosphate dehydrogenase
MAAVCDCENEADLRAIVEAAEQLPPNTCLVGSAALLEAISTPAAAPAKQAQRFHGPIVFVVGSRSAMAQAQLAALTRQVSEEIVIPESGSASSSPRVIRAAVAANLDRLRRAGVLVLSGGETARAVLDGLEITDLVAVARWEHGAVASTDETGRLIVTKPGAHGDEDALLIVARSVRTMIDGAALPQEKV